MRFPSDVLITKKMYGNLGPIVHFNKAVLFIFYLALIWPGWSCCDFNLWPKYQPNPDSINSWYLSKPHKNTHKHEQMLHLDDLSLSRFTDEVSVVCALIEYWLTEILPIQREQKTWRPQVQILRGKRLWITSRSLIVISHNISSVILFYSQGIQETQNQIAAATICIPFKDPAWYILVYFAFTIIITYEKDFLHIFCR